MTPELANKLATLRQRAISGPPLTREEHMEAIAALREARSGAAVVARTNARAVKMGIAPVNTKNLLEGLGIGAKK